MKGILTNRGRLAATVLAGAALLVGGTATASASAQSPLAGLFGSPGTAQSSPSTPSTLGSGSGLPGLGLFKTLFAVFGAVRAQVPTLAAPIISQAVTDGTITSTEAAQLTVWLSGQHGPSTAGAGPSAMTETKSSSGDGTATKPSAGEISVLHKVFAAVIAQLATIAAPVLASEVKNGDITQAEADMISKILGKLAAGAAAGVGTGAPTTAGLGAGAASSNLLAAVETKVAAQVKKATKHHKRKHKKATLAVRKG